MVEKDLQRIFTAWVEENKQLVPNSTGWELKLEKSKRFAFDRVAPHQVTRLTEVKYGGLYHKISDTPVSWGNKMRFTKPKPLDCFLLKGDAFVVLCFYHPREAKRTLWIDIDIFLRYKIASPKKSMTEEEAEAIAERVEVLKLNKKS